jgi:hypothetical protein
VKLSDELVGDMALHLILIAQEAERTILETEGSGSAAVVRSHKEE